MEQPFSTAGCRALSAWVYQLCGNVDEVAKQAAEAVAIAAEHGFPMWATWGEILGGWALVMQGGGDRGLAQASAGLAAFDASGMSIWRTYFLALLAELYAAVGKVDHGLEMTARGLQEADEGEGFWRAELLRLRGRLLLSCGAAHRDEAEVILRSALETARAQGCLVFELRAAIDLFELRPAADRSGSAQALADAFSRCTESAGNADRQRAKRLLESI